MILPKLFRKLKSILFIYPWCTYLQKHPLARKSQPFFDDVAHVCIFGDLKCMTKMIQTWLNHHVSRCSRMCTSETFVRSRQTASIFGQIAIKLQYRWRLSKTLLGNWHTDSGSAKKYRPASKKRNEILADYYVVFKHKIFRKKICCCNILICRRGANFFSYLG